MNRAEHHPVSFVIFLSLVFFPSSIIPSQFLVPQQYRTIQSAINTARPGDTVLVDEGIYYENILINKNIVVASRFIKDGKRSHIERTVINGSRPKDKLKASVVRIHGKTDTTCEVLGFTLRGGTGTYLYLIENNAGTAWITGGGIYILNAGARIAHNIITENILSTRIKKNFTFGAGISTVDTTLGTKPPPYLIIEHNTVTGNRSTGEYAEAGGIFTSQPGVIRHNVITDNRDLSRGRAPGGGLSVSVADYEVLIDGNYISRNIAGIGGGILITSGFIRRGRIIVTNNIISENEAYELGGGVIVAEHASALFINNTIVNNKARSRGGGINISLNGHVTLINNILWKNEIDQIASWQQVQALHNLIDGGYPGKNSIFANPGFVPGDTLFRLLPESPAIGTGTNDKRLMGKNFPLPLSDYFGSSRRVPVNTEPDLGAVESKWGSNGASADVKEEWPNTTESNLKLTISFNQISAPTMSPDSLYIERGGRIAMTMTINDSSTFVYRDTTPELSFILPPGKNLLEIELQAGGRDSSKGIVCSFKLDGLEPQYNALLQSWKFRYHAYPDLRPGSYTLVLFPQDEINYLDDTNKVFIAITVLPYWYNRWWAYTMFAFLVMLIAFVVYRSREKRLRFEMETSRLSELDRHKSRFLANVSHELRTPLSLILGPVEYLRAQKMEKENNEQLGIIQRNAQRLLRLIELLLQFSRLESGTIRLQVAHEEVVQILRRISGYFSSPAAKKQIELKFIAEQERITGLIDAEKIDHILQNCISNAIKFTPPGGTIEVRAGKENNDLVFSVYDTGEGISAEHLPHVFERFYRVDTTHKTEGTGIGLSLSKELAEIHHGSIHLESALGKGTVVKVRIPLSGYSSSEMDARHNDDSSKQEPVQISSSRTIVDTIVDSEERPIILIAEDNEDARIFIRTQLMKQYSILEASDGLDALNKTKFQIPDLVISDVMMPKMDGRELCKALKHDERTSHIPVILLTALAEKEDRIKGLTTGADDYLVKPFDSQELLTRVYNLLENRKKLREAYGKTVPLSLGEISVTSLDDTFLIKAIAIVTTHIAEPEFGVENFAHEIFLSRMQLHRKLTAITNLAPSDFIRYLRLKRAKELLERNTGTIAEIADSVGFSNHSYFAKCFQEQFGLLPNEVRHPQKY